ncbi:hypothetical protein [Hydrogenophaga intermedia]|uniref:hypothetical protein n=1 Tax=Hydrogenophaga intermedia TaxID=65786 RepID=UPI002042E57B|nr:hypothetical protein [Hydrogenophaga intermedia]MCM3562769.1 hypothetical protein [Hydrogenophaga intermedia]
MDPSFREDDRAQRQLFEHDAGCDLASLKTPATPAGDPYAVNGLKIWPNHAHCFAALRGRVMVQRRRAGMQPSMSPFAGKDIA